MGIKSFLFIVFALTLFVSDAQALNLKWLEFSPVKYFTAEDWEMIRQAAGKALKEKPNGETVRWNNESSDHYGSLTPISTLEMEGKTCRDLVIRNFAGGVNGGGTYRFCQMEDGTWKTVGGELGK
ncbi:MAG: hypothetical protein KZQ80_01715 [Candidatus Thiodiazotropha sp. (ex Monitilora ramsayi)]|nr:hypothetical protein [Candidatus Thiodiazotropha sp. (ex Monitilora ramsayi)]